MKTAKRKKLTGEAFDALSDSDKQRIFEELNNKTTEDLLRESQPLNPTERSKWRQIKKKMGRPRIGKGTTNISVSLEKGLLREADRFARDHGLSRSQLIAQGVRAIIGSAA